MAAGDIVPVPVRASRRRWYPASPHLLREPIRGFAQRLMDAEVGQLRAAGNGEVSPDRTNVRNGYRPMTASIAAHLVAWCRPLGLHYQDELRNAEPDTLRYRLWSLPARLVRHGRRHTLKISATWPWTDAQGCWPIAVCRAT